MTRTDRLFAACVLGVLLAGAVMLLEQLTLTPEQRAWRELYAVAVRLPGE